MTSNTKLGLLVLIGFIVALVSLTSLAHARTHSATYSISLNASDPVPYGSSVTFNYDSGGYKESANSGPLEIRVTCVNNGTVVYDSWGNALTPGVGTTPIPYNLGPPLWLVDESAACTATLLYFQNNKTVHELVSMGFSVIP